MDKAFRILLIEDDRYISGFTAVSLRKEGYEVDVAQSADEGLFLYASQHPDIVLLDLGLPDRDGGGAFGAAPKIGFAHIGGFSARSGA